MYTFSKRLKIVSILLFVVGAIGWGTSYVATHGLTLDDVKVLLAATPKYVTSLHKDLNNGDLPPMDQYTLWLFKQLMRHGYGKHKNRTKNRLHRQKI